MRFLHLIRPVMCVLPEVASPDRKVSTIILEGWIFSFSTLILRVESESSLYLDGDVRME